MEQIKKVSAGKHRDITDENLYYIVRISHGPEQA